MLKPVFEPLLASPVRQTAIQRPLPSVAIAGSSSANVVLGKLVLTGVGSDQFAALSMLRAVKMIDWNPVPGSVDCQTATQWPWRSVAMPGTMSPTDCVAALGFSESGEDQFSPLSRL